MSQALTLARPYARAAYAIARDAGAAAQWSDALAFASRVAADPRVQAVMSRFPGTQLVEVRRIAPDTGSGADESGPVAAAEEDDDL